MDTAAFAQALERWIGTGRSGRGAQVAVISRGELLLNIGIGTDGRGRPITPESIFPIYCAGKPITSLAIARLVQMGEVSLNDSLGDVLAGGLSADLKQVTLEQLLSHTAGLHYPASLFLANPPAVRDEMIRSLTTLRLPAPGVGAYSEYASWHLLAAVVEEMSGQEFEGFIHELVLEPAGVQSEIFFTSRFSANPDHLRVNVDLTGGTYVPLLWETHPDNLADLRPSCGAHASMRGLAQLYAALLPSSPASVPHLAASIEPLLAARTNRGMDPVLGRELTHGVGFMIQPAQHGVPLSDMSFGHTGLSGMTVAFADPIVSLVVALHFPTATNPDIEDPVERRRELLSILLE